jgi:hypothetical protein
MQAQQAAHDEMRWEFRGMGQSFEGTLLLLGGSVFRNWGYCVSCGRFL